MSTPTLTYLPIALVAESPSNYRKAHDQARHLELVESIRTHGILTPLIVRRLASTNGVHEVAAGHRRLRAARAAGLTEVPVSARDMDDRELLEVMLTENIHHLHPDPLDEADAYVPMMEQLGYDVATLAAKFGKSETYIRHRLVLANLSPTGRSALERGAIELGHAVLLARVGHVKQDALLSETLLHARALPMARYRADDEEAASVDEDYDAGEQAGSRRVASDPVRTLVSIAELRERMAETLLPLSCVKWDRADPTLVPAAGSCQACPKRTGANPSLFAELDPADDRCADAACYATKKLAWLEARVAAVRSQAPNTVLVSQARKRKVKTMAGLPVLRTEVEWKPTKAGARGSVPAIVVESDRFDLQDQWKELGALIDVKRVKPETKAREQTSRESRTSGQASRELENAHRSALGLFNAGVRAVLTSILNAPAPLVDRRDQFIAASVGSGGYGSAPMFSYNVRDSVLEVLHGTPLGDDDEGESDDDEETDETEAVMPASELAVSSRLAMLLASVCLLKLSAPHFNSYAYGKRNDPVIDDTTGAYPLPPALIALAAESDVDAQAVWTTAIAAHAETLAAAA